jgi:hypothetical protein
MKTKLKLYFEIAGLFLDIIGILPELAALVIWAKIIEKAEKENATFQTHHEP